MKNRKWFRRVSLGLLVLFVLAIVPSTFAADARGDDTIIIEAGETINDDLYVAGETIQIDGTVNGDVIFGANKIEINGTVTGDLMGGGQEIIINGSVGDDVRVGSTAVTVNGSVAGDLIAGGYGIHVAEGASVGGDIMAGGLSVAIDGNVGGDFRFGALGVRINGNVGGDVKGEVGSAEEAPPFDPAMFNPTAPDYERTDPGLEIGPNASIGGSLEYESIAQFDVSDDAIGGDVVFNETVTEAAEEVSVGSQIWNRVWRAVQQWLVLMLIGFLVLTFVPNLVQRASSMINEQPLPAVGWGILWYIAWPIVLGIAFLLIIVLAVILGALTLDTVAGVVVGVGMLILGIELGLYFLILAFIAKLIVAHLLGERLMSGATSIVAYAVGALIVVALGALPVVGGLANFLIAAAGLGAIWFMWRNRNGGEKVIEKEPAHIIA